jgi:hypothetical protein
LPRVLPSFCSTWGRSVSKAGVAQRWLRAISASGKRNFLNFALPLNVETVQLFVHFFWLIYTEDRSRANNLLAISRRNWGLEAYLYEFTVSKYLESVDGPMLSSTGVPNWVPSVSTSSILRMMTTKECQLTFLSKATPYNAFRSAARKRSMLGSTSSTVTSRPIAAQLSFKKKRVLNKKTRSTIRIKNPAFDRGVKLDMSEWTRCMRGDTVMFVTPILC